VARILAVDPGLTTGVATREPDGSWTTLNLHDPTGAVLWKLVKQWPWDHVVLENYASRHAGPDGDQTLRILGGVWGICITDGIAITVEWPNERRWKLVAAEAMLRAVPGAPAPTQHQIDSLAHLLNWEARRGNA